MKKFIVFITILALGFGFFYLKKHGVEKGNPSAMQENKLIRDSVKSETEQVAQQSSPTQEFLMNEVESNGARILGGGENVSIQRFWFPGDALDSTFIFYVEYENSKGEQRKSLVQKEQDTEYKIVAEFFPGLDEWELESGDDILFGKELIMYESR